MDIHEFIKLYPKFKTSNFENRFIKHAQIGNLIDKLPLAFNKEILGYSVEGKSIYKITWGNGPIKIMLWSQMHGNEVTGTYSIFDLISLLQDDTTLKALFSLNIEELKSKFQFILIPMVNPDGAEIFTRRNAQQIDINRDFIQEVAPESTLLKNVQSKYKPHFGFNLHDQTTLWSVKGSKLPATLSFLAPPIDDELTITPGRLKAMQVIAHMNRNLQQIIPNQIGLFDDEFEPRAFGDNFQKTGMSTILIEAGGYTNDYEKQEIRVFYLGAILTAIKSIATNSFEVYSSIDYNAIPKNSKEIFHIIIDNIILNNSKISIALNYEEQLKPNLIGVNRIYKVADIGDLNTYNAYDRYNADNYQIKGEFKFEEIANFEILKNEEIILSFKNGELL